MTPSTRKWLRFPFWSLVVAAMGLSCSRQPEWRPAPRFQGEPAAKLAGFLAGETGVLVLAHQGFHRDDPPNSIASFEKALALGADGIELDVVSASDGTPMVLHNHTLDRLTNEKGAVIDRSASELVQIPLRGNSGERIPTLESVLDRFGGRMVIWIEVKKVEPRENGLELRVAKLVRKAGQQSTTLISSFSWEAVENLLDTFEDVNVAYEIFDPSLARTVPERYQSRLTISYGHKKFRAEHARQVKNRYRGISVFTPDSGRDLRRVIRDGATLIQTDRPGAALRLLQ